MSKTASLDYFFPNWRYTFDESRRSEVGLHELVEIVLIQGGSLGAKSINEAVGTFIKEMLEKHPQRFFIWQTGSKHFRALKEKIDGDHQRLYISE
jgi:UDP-N-acetylglucosamine:LPS N-acetylglucosamine transferase